MGIRRLDDCPVELALLPGQERFEWFQVENRGGPCAVFGLAANREDMEIHLEMLRWGPDVVRTMRRDLEWVREYARKSNKRRVVGFKATAGVEGDTLWPKFTRLFGFGGHVVVQIAFLDV